MSRITLKLVLAALFVFTLMLVVSQLFTGFLNNQKENNRSNVAKLITPTQKPLEVPPPEQITQGYRENYIVNLYSDRMVVPKQGLYRNDNVSFMNNDDKTHQVEFNGKPYTVKTNEMLGFSISDAIKQVTIADKTLSQTENIEVLYE